MSITETDCRSEDGITVGLIDSIITAARVLAARDKSPQAVTEALKDLASDEDVRALLAAPAVERQEEQQMACMPVERCYDVRVKMIMAFNEARKSGDDLDGGLDAAYKAALRYSPTPLLASPPPPIAVVLPDRKQITGNSIADVEVRAHNACLNKVKEMNQ